MCFFKCPTWITKEIKEQILVLLRTATISAPVTQRMKTLVIYVVLSTSRISSELT